MNDNTYYKGLAEIAALVVGCLAILWIICPGATATIIQMGQGDTAYLNETADLSLITSWPLYQLAWCESNEAGCGNPLIYDLSNISIKKVWLNPNYFKPGDYFRWDGKWNRGENSYAMTLIAGTRPTTSINTSISIENETLFNTSTSRVYPTSTHIVLARGDTITYKYHITNVMPDSLASIWMFNTEPYSTYEMILGEPIRYNFEDEVYEWEIPVELSRKLVEGEYFGYIQFAGDNRRQDIYHVESHKVGDNRVDVIDTLFDDDLVPDISIDGLTSSIVLERLNIVKDSRYIDDVFVPITMSVEIPMMVFTEYGSNDKAILISGLTNYANNTEITLMLDPGQHVLKEDVRAYTWKTTVYGDTSSNREWNAALGVVWDDLSIGTHTIRAIINTNGLETIVYKDFKVTDVFVMPTPTPQRERVVVEEYGWHRITPVPTMTPESEDIVEVVATTIPIPETTIIQIAEPTQNETIVPTPTPRETIPTLPVEPFVAIIAVLGALCVMRK